MRTVMQKGLRICNSEQDFALLLRRRCCGRRMDMQGSTGHMTRLRAPWPPDPFRYLEGRLCVGGLPLDEVVAATGTPAYVYDLDAVAAAYRRGAARLVATHGGGGRH